MYMGMLKLAKSKKYGIEVYKDFVNKKEKKIPDSNFLFP